MIDFASIAGGVVETVLTIVLTIAAFGIISIVPYLLTKRLIKYALEYYFQLKRLNRD